MFSSDDSGTSSYLGVDITDVTTERLSALKLKEEKGVEVTMVDQDAPAGKAGIKEHDVILTMNGTTIESGAQLRRMIHETAAGPRGDVRPEPGWPADDGEGATGRQAQRVRHVGPIEDIHFNMPEIHDAGYRHPVDRIWWWSRPRRAAA